MKRRMEQLINGRFEYEVPKLLLSGEEIRLSTTPKDRARGELVLAAEDRSRIKGIAWSSHRRFLLGKEKFSGEQIQIPYGVDAKGLKDGDTIEGEVVLSTSIGEYRVPFFVLVKKPEVKSSQGTLGSFDDFVKLAREDFREAYRLFLDPSFAEILKGEPGLLPVYGSMSKNPVPYQNLEEFLIGSGRKQPVMLSLEKDRLELYEVQTSLKDTLRLKRSGWGYLRAEVTVEGDFLEVEKKVIGDGHFIGSYYDLEYIIRKENLGRGKNYGRIRIQTVYQTLTYTVTASKGSRIQVNVTAYEKRKRLEGSRDFLAMCMGKLPVQEWAKKALQMLEELAENGYFSVESQLYEAYVHTRAGDKAKARMLLDALEKNQRVRKEETVRGAFYYVDYLAERSADSSRTLAEKIWQLYRRRPDSFLHTLENMGPAPEPNLTVLYSSRLPEAFKDYASRISIKTSSVQYENDDAMKPVWGDDYAICCCVSATQTGKEMQFFGARANLAKCLLYAINGGVDEKTGDQVGPKYRPITSEYLDYDEVMERYDDMMEWLADLYVNTLNLIQYMHDKYYYEAAELALMDTDLKRTFATGIAGFSHVIDSLSAIKYAKVKVIRDENGIAKDYEIEGDFPRYGNDDDRADEIGVWLLRTFMDKIKKHHTYRRSEPTTSILTITSNVVYGKATGSMPDGRKAGEPLSPGANPSYGAEKNGLLASLNSLTKLPYEWALDGISNTQTINPGALGNEEEERVTNLVQVMDGYFDQGAHHLNVNVFGKEKLIDAMEHPEKEEYANFTIRVSGYAVKFIDLTREQQLDVIARTCHERM